MIASLLECLSFSSLLKILRVLHVKIEEELILDKLSVVQALTHAYLLLEPVEQYKILSVISNELGYSEEQYSEDIPYAISL